MNMCTVKLKEKNFEVQKCRREKHVYCGEDLALSAYYRHMNEITGGICPAQRIHDNQNLDSTFDFGPFVALTVIIQKKLPVS